MKKVYAVFGFIALTLAMALVACGGGGLDGAPGENGAPGEQGLDGESCFAEPLKDKSGYTLICGDEEVGVIKNGSNGENGTSCTVRALADGSGYAIVCGDETVGQLLNGAPGKDGESVRDTVVVKDTLVVKDTVILAGDTVVLSRLDTLVVSQVDTVVLNQVDTVLIKDTLVTKDTLVVKDTLVEIHRDTVYIGILESSSSVSSSSVTLNDSERSSSSKSNWAYLNPAKTYGEFTDARDGQVYKTIEICDKNDKNCQTWMAENLNYDPGDVSSMGSSAWSGCYGEGSEGFTEEQVVANCSKYGRLYTWEVAMDKAGCGYGNYCENKYEGTQGVCPEGWHLPTNTDRRTLFTNNVGGTNTAGKLLKANTSLWYENTGTDSFGFAVLPAGERGYYGDFSLEGDYASFWSSTEKDYRDADSWSFGYDFDCVYDFWRYKYYAFSVRCLRDSN